MREENSLFFPPSASASGKAANQPCPCVTHLCLPSYIPQPPPSYPLTASWPSLCYSHCTSEGPCSIFFFILPNYYGPKPLKVQFAVWGN